MAMLEVKNLSKSFDKLEVLKENVSQTEANKTRFYVVSRHANELAGYDCVIIDEAPTI